MSVDAKGMTETRATLTSLPDILATVSHEVRLLADSAGELQNLLGNLVFTVGAGGSSALYDLQALDRLSQSLEAMSDFVGELAKLSPPDWKIDATAASHAVGLAELGRRLNGAACIAEEATGDFEFFETLPLTA